MKPAVGIDWLAVGRKEYKEMRKKWALKDAKIAEKRKLALAAKRKANKIKKAKEPERKAAARISRINKKLSKTLRARAINALKSKGIRKSFQSHVRLLGCTVAEARKHIESQFKPWMSWENHGPRGWHIDHIKPLSAFDLADPAQVAEACHFTNLRPLHWRENLVKGGVKSRLSSGA